MNSLRKDITGQRYGRLVVTSFAHRDKRGKAYWNTVCDCGNTHVAQGANLGSRITSCGCFQAESRLMHSTTHGMGGTKAYNIWAGMIQRCTNKSHEHYRDYGGRGITVCKHWLKFEGFIADMGCPEAGMSIDRIDNNAGYSPENCRWSTKKDQARNRRSNRLIEFNGETLPLAAWAERHGMLIGTLWNRISLGWTLEDAFTRPLRKSAQ